MQQWYSAAVTILDGLPYQDRVLQVRNGVIAGVHDRAEVPDAARAEVRDLGDVALMPGLVNAHSHAFQRDIRGATEWTRAGEEDDFWSWRTKMYEAALAYSADAFEASARRVYEEMALTGITCVGEFHYVHHRPDGTPYDDPNELAHRAIRAAREVGLRVVLLRAAYQRAGFERDENPRQRRFIEHSPQVFIERLEALREAWVHDPGVRVGMAPHSIRAVDAQWLRHLSRYAAAHDLPLHIHASEQRGELEQARAEYGTTPIHALEQLGVLEAPTTIVHATHASDDEIAILAQHPHVTVCACPTTERNLGDGFLPARRLMMQRVPISLGSDSHTSIDLWEEMRMVEGYERLRMERRNVLADAWDVWGMGEGRRDVARLLLPMATRHGASCLGVEAGELKEGLAADMVAIDLKHPSMRGIAKSDITPAAVMSLKLGAVRDVWVGGEAVVRQGRLAARA